MAVTFVSATVGSESSAASTARTLSQPSGLAVNDWEILTLHTSALCTITMSAGWKRLTRRTAGAYTYEVWAKKVTALPNTDTMTPSVSVGIAWVLSAWRGCHGVDAIATAYSGNGQQGSTTVYYRDTESYAAGSVALRCLGTNQGAAPASIPSGTTQAGLAHYSGTPQRRAATYYASCDEGSVGEITQEFTGTTTPHQTTTLVLHPDTETNAAEAYFVQNNLKTGSGFQEATATQPAESQSTVGWNYGTVVADRYALMDSNAEVVRTKAVANEGWVATVLPATNPSNTLGDGIIIGPLNGTYKNRRIFIDITGAGNTTSSGTHRMRARLFKTTLTGGSPVQIGTGTVESPDMALSGPQLNGGLMFVDPGGEMTFNNEYLVVQLAWRVVAAGTNTGHDFNIRPGTSAIVLPPQVAPATTVNIVAYGDANGNDFVLPQITKLFNPRGDVEGVSFAKPEITRLLKGFGFAEPDGFGGAQITKLLNGMGFAEPSGFGQPSVTVHLKGLGDVEGAGFASSEITRLLSSLGDSNGEGFTYPAITKLLEALGADEGSGFGSPLVSVHFIPFGDSMGDAFTDLEIARLLSSVGDVDGDAFGIPSVTKFLEAVGEGEAEGVTLPEVTILLMGFSDNTGEGFALPKANLVVIISAFGNTEDDSYGGLQITRLIGAYGENDAEGFGITEVWKHIGAFADNTDESTASLEISRLIEGWDTNSGEGFANPTVEALLVLISAFGGVEDESYGGLEVSKFIPVISEDNADSFANLEIAKLISVLGDNLSEAEVLLLVAALSAKFRPNVATKLDTLPDGAVTLRGIPEGAVRVLPIPGGSVVLKRTPAGVVILKTIPQGGVRLG